MLSAGMMPLARAEMYVLPPGNGDLIGAEQTVIIGSEPTLADVAREHDIGHEEIRNANPDVEFWLPGAGTEVVLPKSHILPRARYEGIVLNVPEMRLYYFPQECSQEQQCTVITYPVSIGRQDWQTPLGDTHVTGKKKDPPWNPPESIRAEAAAEGGYLPSYVPPGPDNPMGAYAIYLDIPGYRIHGTNKPYGVGIRATHGCVRLYPEDIEALFEQVKSGTKVQIVSQPVKFGWRGDTLYMEVHPPLEEDLDGNLHLEDMAFNALGDMALERSFVLNSLEFQRALSELSGMPVAVAQAREEQYGDNRTGISRPGSD
jgi:L,D-transpeptidase ErfK/SrfK